MINEVKVTGFKSLQDFSLSIRPGLNVLVGPNGSGKSNILSFFEFVSNLTKYSLPEAVSRSGGAGTIFRRLPDQKISGSILVEISGHGKSSSRRFVRSRNYYRHAESDIYIDYRLLFEIKLSESGTSLKFGRQRLSLSIFRDPKLRAKVDRKTGEKKWHVDLDIETIGDIVNITNNKINYKALKSAMGRSVSKLNSIYIGDPQETSNYILPRIIDRFYPFVSKVFSDISTGYVYNLNPNKIKEPEDIARPVEISQDGAGLAATLFRIQESEIVSHLGPYFNVDYYDRNISSLSLDDTKKYYFLINENIIDIVVRNDALDNKLVVISKVLSEEGEIEIPLAMLSDGTVKWFSMVTAILSKKSIFSIEEPENFLHPQMQKEFISVIRSNSSQENEIFSLITTHSETLINSLDPDEIVICRMDRGRTVLVQDVPVEILRQEINKTGFGLGHYYVNGMLY